MIGLFSFLYYCIIQFVLLYTKTTLKPPITRDVLYIERQFMAARLSKLELS